ncbi:hypothetical protein ACLOJK_036219 [Asimina triloba]
MLLLVPPLRSKPSVSSLTHYYLLRRTTISSLADHRPTIICSPADRHLLQSSSPANHRLLQSSFPSDHRLLPCQPPSPPALLPCQQPSPSALLPCGPADHRLLKSSSTADHRFIQSSSPADHRLLLSAVPTARKTSADSISIPHSAAPENPRSEERRRRAEMHGRPRKPLKPEDEEASRAKAANLRTLQNQLLHIHHNKMYFSTTLCIDCRNSLSGFPVVDSCSPCSYDKDALEISAKLLEINPEIYTAWNYRKLAVEHNLRSETDADSMKAVLDEELRVVENALRQNFKSYGAWHHRKWVLSKGFSSIERELKILALKNVSEEEELKFTTDKIKENFSNYSSWHNRSQAVDGDLIWKPLSCNKSGRAHAWMTYLELHDMKSHALKTYPVKVTLGHSQGIISSNGSNYNHTFSFQFNVNLQSTEECLNQSKSVAEIIVWEDNSSTSATPNPDFSPPVLALDQLRICEGQQLLTISKWQTDTLASEIDLFRELLSVINCKIGKLMLARLLMAHDALHIQERIHSQEVLELFDDLITLDPVHESYYKDERSLVLMEQVTSNRDSLSKHCSYYKELMPSRVQPTVCLRLNNLALSRIGFFERLLWVQMLDLSYNELHSIEGLEALQLLKSLNLSNNKFSSFTALEPLRLIKSLRALDISHNEIGEHPIDTTRYSFSSPLSHAVGGDWNLKEYMNDSFEDGCWEAVVIFKDMNLIQLDVVGNAICNEHFRKLLVNIIRTLKWIDGVRI